MATLILSTVGSTLGTILGGPLGATIGYTLGALGGQLVDRSLFSSSGRDLGLEPAGELQFQTSTQGVPIPKIYGTVRVAGQVIWAADYKKHDSPAQGKNSSARANDRYYTASIAIALGEGEINSVGRIWADGQLMDMSQVIWRLHKGRQDQRPDPLLLAKERFAPAYRGCAYIVFENLNLSSFGNRLPQMNFEVTRVSSNSLKQVRAVTLIPGATEWGYAPEPIIHYLPRARATSQNRNTNFGRKTDIEVSIDQLKDSCPNCDYVSLVVAWFGSSLDAGACQIKPKVHRKDVLESPHEWHVNGIGRSDVETVSYVNDRPAYGGTPSDRSVVLAIRYLKQQGFKVMFHPFIMMDVAGYPWRGWISSAGATSKAAVKLKAKYFFGDGASSDFQFNSSRDGVSWSPQTSYQGNIWGLRRMIHHYAWLCVLAGGVDAFLIGSELGGVTSMTDGQGTYPSVSELKKLARSVNTILPNTKISYGANWDEYRGHQPSGTGSFYFHLDPVWADASVDFVGINYYAPLADWRDDYPNLDASTAHSIYDLDYLRGNIKGGEAYDWYYASPSARKTQTRSSISDGDYQKHWIWRAKDISSWWSNLHYHRDNSVERDNATGWQAGMKPIWFTEAGCPAIDKGANEPNKFSDFTASSSVASGFPYFSNRLRDDYMQKAVLKALLSAFDPDDPDHLDDFNVSVNGKRMMSSEHIFFWCWDARPYPWFPDQLDIWSDGVNWARGHWLTGRASYTEGVDIVKNILTENNFYDYNIQALRFLAKGFYGDKIAAPRDFLDGLMRFFFFDAVERNGKIHFLHRDQEPVLTITPDDCVNGPQNEPPYQLLRLQDEELPSSIKLIYIDETNQYRQAVAEARRQVSSASYVAQARLPIIASPDEAHAAAQIWLHETLIARERAIFRLPPSRFALEPADIIQFNHHNGQNYLMRITDIRDEHVLIVEAVRVEPYIYKNSSVRSDSNASSSVRTHRKSLSPAVSYGPPLVEIMDLPHLRGDETLAPHIAIYADPRPPFFAVYRSASGQHDWHRLALLDAQPIMAIIENTITPAQEACWDETNILHVRLLHGELMSRSEQDVLNGENVAAIKHVNGWEIIQFREAELVAGQDNASLYHLRGLLRGLAGTESEMRSDFDDNPIFVLLEPNKIPQINFAPIDVGLPYFWRIGAANQPYSDPAYRVLEATYLGINQRPLSPIHLYASKNNSGDITISWIRRSRDLTHDGWGQQDVLLAEISQAFEVDILKNNQPIRTLHSNETEIIYSQTDQNQDFSAPLTQISVRVYQISASFGRGAPRKETLYV